MITESPITGSELFAKRETACWQEVHHWRGLASMESETVWNRCSRPGNPDYMYRLTAELTVEQISGEDSYRVMIREQILRDRDGDPFWGTVEVSWYESPGFNRLSDAQLWGDWAITRWHQTERFTAAGATIRTDLDEKGNPYGE